MGVLFLFLKKVTFYMNKTETFWAISTILSITWLGNRRRPIFKPACLIFRSELRNMKETFPKPHSSGTEALFGEISQQLDFSSCGEEGNSSDNTSDDCTGLPVCSPGLAGRAPRVQHHSSRSNSSSSPLQSASPIPYASWRKLRLCETPNTPKVRTFEHWHAGKFVSTTS